MTRQLDIEVIARPTGLDYLKRVFVGLIVGIIISVTVGAGVWALSVGVPSKESLEKTEVPAIIQWIYHTNSSVGIRESVWVFPIIEGTHLLGIALSAGALCWFDLRLLGFAFRDERISRV